MTDFSWYKFSSESGTTFIVAPSEKMISTVLPDIFFHRSVAAFTRQLNVRFYAIYPSLPLPFSAFTNLSPLSFL